MNDAKQAVTDLHAAARLLRETASNATPGPWEDTPDALWFGGQVWGYRIRKDGNFPVGDSGSPDPAWIALASPALAEPLADLLYRAADDLAGAIQHAEEHGGDPFELVDEPGALRSAIVIARPLKRTQP